MVGGGVVHPVHGQGFGVVVNGHIHRTPKREFDTSARASAACKVVNDNFFHGN
jgi:hypothetical protein